MKPPMIRLRQSYLSAGEITVMVDRITHYCGIALGDKMGTRLFLDNGAEVVVAVQCAEVEALIAAAWAVARPSPDGIET